MQPLEVATAPLVETIRRERPHVLLTYDENGGYPHPDHIMTHRISMEAFDAAGEGRRFPEAGEPWRPLKIYYHMTFSKGRVMALHEACLARGIESPYAERLEHWVDRPEDAARVTTRVPCGDYFKVRDAALIAHATQVDPEGSGSACRSRSTRTSGQPRTTSWSSRTSPASSPRTTSSRASGRRTEARRAVVGPFAP
jgi:mycothiol S-conjugate amidase